MSICSRAESRIPRYLGLPAANLQRENKCVPEGIDCMAIIASVYSHQGSSNVSESFDNFNVRMRVLCPLLLSYDLNNEQLLAKL